MSTKTAFVISSIAVVALMIALIVTLTMLLKSPLPVNGGSPSNPNATEPATDVKPTDAIDPAVDGDGGLSEDGYQAALGKYRYASVSADSKTCSQIGVEILARLGGTAADAAVAAMFCTGVVNRHSTGVGGGHFATVHAKSKVTSQWRDVTVFARERAPGAATRDMYVGKGNASYFGGLSIGVPGEVYGLYQLWSEFGNIPWADLVAPSIKLARDGFSVPSALASAIKGKEAYIRNDPNLAEVLLNPDGSLLKEGDIGYDLKLADTLDKIAADPMDFYTGTLADDIVKDIQDYSGIITKEDLVHYEVLMKDPLRLPVKNGAYQVLNGVPPTSGAVLNLILGLVDGFNFNTDSIASEDAATLTFHRILEAFKFAYAKRSSLGDAEFVDVEELITNMTSADYISSIRAKIDDAQTHDVDYYEPDFQYSEDHGTAHLSVLASDGSAVALTTTINFFFGSLTRGSRTGIIFNDEMDDFSTPNTTNEFGVPASETNYIEPGKMPMSSMTPTIVLNENNEPVVVTGASGGTRITTAIAWVLLHSLWFDQNIGNATNAARLHHQLVPNEISYEYSFNNAVLTRLREDKLHSSKLMEGYLAVVGSIHNTCPSTCGDACRNQECIHAASDGRKGGEPDGY